MASLGVGRRRKFQTASSYVVRIESKIPPMFSSLFTMAYIMVSNAKTIQTSDKAK